VAPFDGTGRDLYKLGLCSRWVYPFKLGLFLTRIFFLLNPLLVTSPSSRRGQRARNCPIFPGCRENRLSFPRVCSYATADCTGTLKTSLPAPSRFCFSQGQAHSRILCIILNRQLQSLLGFVLAIELPRFRMACQPT
jgi:hypothetical protein